MGLASALTTALTGITAAETQIDVIGNNLANSQTVGFKESDVFFATQFAQTLALGSSPTANNGGVNPQQVGLGTQVAEISPNFTQGTIELSSVASDLALQGEGFFIVEGRTGERLYTRNGVFRTNSQNELVSSTGDRLLGFGINNNFELQTNQLVPLDIPIGTASIAQATQNVVLGGILTPNGDVADYAEVVESAVLGDAAVPRADATATNVNVAALPDETGTTPTISTTGGSLNANTDYEYRFSFTDTSGTETLASGIVTANTGGAGDTVTLNNLPGLTAPATYSNVNVYRREVGAPDTSFRIIGQTTQGAASFADNGLASGAVLDTSSVSGNYSYLVTYHRNSEEESRPSIQIGPTNVASGRIQLRNLPTPPVPGPNDTFPAYDQVRIYRNLSTDPNSYFLVDTVSPGGTYTDGKSDAEISDLTNPNNKALDLDGPKIDTNTLLTDVLARQQLEFSQVFQEGTLEFSGKKGGKTLAAKSFTIGAASTVQDLIEFLEQAAGIQQQGGIPTSLNKIPGESGGLGLGGTVNSGKLRFVSNNGVANALDFDINAFRLTNTTGDISVPFLGFQSIQSAEGQGASTDLLVFDSLGIPLELRISAVLEQRTSTQTIYRWYADSPANSTSLGAVAINVGSGQVIFDGQGGLVSAETTLSIGRDSVPSVSPLEINLDFSTVSGLANTPLTGDASQEEALLTATSQDGQTTGQLASFSVGSDGVIRGSFTNGATETLGQVRLARFTNSEGLEQRGLNQFAEGANSGLPIQGNPGDQGIATIIGGAVELSNTDIGQSLVDLVLATTQYRGNTRVITAAQQLLDELLNLRR